MGYGSVRSSARGRANDLVSATSYQQQVERNGGHSDPLFKGGHFESSSMEPESELSPDQVLGHVGVPVGGPSIIPPHAATRGYLPFPPAGRARQSWRHGTGGVACLVRVRACPQQSPTAYQALQGVTVVPDGLPTDGTPLNDCSATTEAFDI